MSTHTTSRARVKPPIPTPVTDQEAMDAFVAFGMAVQADRQAQKGRAESAHDATGDQR